MKSSLVKAGIPLIIIIVAIAMAMGMIMSRKPPEKKEVKPKAFLVEAAPVQMEDLNFLVKSQGTVQPKIETSLSAQVSGKVVSVSDAFIEGGMFKKGDVLVQLEQADFITDLKLAEAELARATAALEEEQARGKVAAEEWKTVTFSVAPELGLRKPQLAKELANVSGAEAQVERAKRNLQRSTIRAPYDGLVKAKNVDLGQFVATGTQVGMVYSTEIAEVRMPLSDNDLAFLQLPTTAGGEVSVTLSARVAGKDVQWQGRLARDEGVLDSQSRVIYAIAEVNDPYLRGQGQHSETLKFGRFVQAEIIGDRGENMVVLPRHVLRLDGTVLVITDERKIKVTEVSVQRADESFVYINAGLRQGDMVAMSTVPNAYDGMVVRFSGDPVDDASSKGEDAETEVASVAANGGK